MNKENFVTLPDGICYFWPSKNEGVYSISDLYAIIAWLECRNSKQMNVETYLENENGG